ncbi:MAG TPA: hypothetical protein VNS99_12765 [Gaiellales bacterium]|nr:hypothetical protein [Gaiellales bacterium]
MLRTAIPVVAVMLALLTGVGTGAPDRPFPIYPRQGGPPRAASAMVSDASNLSDRRPASRLQVYLNP